MEPSGNLKQVTIASLGTGDCKVAFPALPLDLFAEQQRALRRMLSFPRVVELVCETRVGTTSHEVVFEKRTLIVLCYRMETRSHWPGGREPGSEADRSTLVCNPEVSLTVTPQYESRRSDG